MPTRNNKLQRAVLGLRTILRDWPDMTWEDARALYAHSVWSYSDIRSDELSMGDDSGPGAGHVALRDLEEAWTIAKGLASV